MFRRKYIWFGPPVSDDGFKFRLYCGHKTAYYEDYRGKFSFGFEAGVLIPGAYPIKDVTRGLSPSEQEEILDRVVRGLRFMGYAVEVFGQQ